LRAVAIDNADFGKADSFVNLGEIASSASFIYHRRSGLSLF